MKFTLSWLYEHLDTKADIKTIESTLTNIGLEVESVEDKSEQLKPFSVAKVISAEKHPDADRLKVCEVKTNKGNYKVVCGAPNAKTGMLGIFAPENTFIPGTKMYLKKSKIRGVESCGMLVSEKEMGISEEHDGIIEIDKKYKIGDSFAEIYGLNDPVIEINITPNRPDCLSVRGIARDLAAAGLGKLKKLKINNMKGSFKSNIQWKRKFNKNEAKLCPGVSGRLFKNVKNTSSPEWLKKRLQAIGLRPISALVDITNYITFDLGRPLHVYDADKINGNLVMRLAKENEKCKTLDEKEYTLSKKMIVIADNNQLHGIGGVMGGLMSGCSFDTTNVFLEVALFDPISVTKTGRKLNLQSDARYRFERGIDHTSINWGVDRATEMIINLCGGEVSYKTTDALATKEIKLIKFFYDKTKNLGGININLNEQIKILKNLGFEIKSKSNKYIILKVPPFRTDIEGEADIVEEIVRIYGYDNIQPISINTDKNGSSEVLSHELKPFYKSKRIIASRGYVETITWSFVSSDFANLSNDNKNVKITNPISSDLNTMRPSIFPNLLSAINSNMSKLYNNGKIFEVGPQFFGNEIQDQQMLATGIQYGNIFSDSWNDEKRRGDFFDIKSDVFFILDQLNVPINNTIYQSSNNNFYHPGKSTQLNIGKIILAQFGEIHPHILKKFEIKTNVNGFEIFLDNIVQFQTKKTSTRKAYNNNPLQLVERDFAFILPQNILAIDIVNSVKKIDKKLIKKVLIFDVFEGDKLPVNMKSIAFKVILQPSEKTFTEDEIEDLSKKIIVLVSQSFEGKLRQ